MAAGSSTETTSWVQVTAVSTCITPTRSEGESRSAERAAASLARSSFVRPPPAGIIIDPLLSMAMTIASESRSRRWRRSKRAGSASSTGVPV